MDQLRSFEFPGRILIYAFSREEAGELLEEVEELLNGRRCRAVANASFNRSRDKKMLKRFGIDPTGRVVEVGGGTPPFHKEPPPGSFFAARKHERLRKKAELRTLLPRLRTQEAKQRREQ